jgi:DNA-binding NtrC family response regulator
MTRADGEDAVVLRDLGSSNGTFVNGARVDRAELGDGDVVRIGDSLFVLRWDDQPDDVVLPTVLGISPAIRRLRSTIDLLARESATVILLGETGTGKEVVARALHDRSARAGASFVAVNCSAIPESLAESMLFGHVAGAFTGASTDSRGVFEAADGGTLFLDELGDLAAAIQPKLLRVLEERSVTRVGSTKSIPFDVRVICATESVLEKEVAESSFRGALYARLAEITVPLPPLRARREDVLLLLRHFVGEDSPSLSPRLAEALLIHRWPFNVRELRTLASELSIRGRNASVLSYDLMAHRLPDAAARASQIPADPPSSRESAREAPPPSREELAAMLIEHEGNVSRIARITGRSRKQVYRWLTEHGLDLEDHRKSPDTQRPADD